MKLPSDVLIETEHQNSHSESTILDFICAKQL